MDFHASPETGPCRGGRAPALAAARTVTRATTRVAAHAAMRTAAAALRAAASAALLAARLVALAATALEAGCATSPSPFFPAGPGARELAVLGIVTTAIVCMVTLLVHVVMAIALWRRRADPPADPLAPPPPGVPDNRRAFRWIIGGTLATTVLLVGFAIASLTTTSAAAPPARAPVTVRVTGHRWWWQVQYLDAGSAVEAESANEIHVPVGARVRLELIGADVIHSFWVPELQGKTDMIPGHPNTAWLQADRVGIYRGQCAEYCGMQHAHMSFLVVAEPADRFRAWLARERQGQEARDTSQGERVFVGSTCGVCHTIRGTRALGKVGPDLTHFGSRRTIGANLLPNNVGELTAWVVDAPHFKPGIIMPKIGLPKGGSLATLTAYLESLK